MIRHLVSAAAILSVAVAAHGQIIVDGTASWNSQSSPVVGNFDASGSDKLVVVLTGEHGFNNNQGTVTSVTYDGVALTPVIERDAQVAETDTIYNHIWILDYPETSTGEIVANVVTRGNVTAFALSGTAEGFGNTAISALGTRSVDLAASGADSLVIASFGLGGNGNTANTNNITADAPLTQVSAQWNGSSWDGHVTGYASPGIGTTSYSFTGGNATGAHVIAAEFLLGPPPPLLTLEVNITSGATRILGDADDPVTITYYAIASPGGSLSTAGWNSLSDQDYEGNGTADGSGNGWEEAGGSDAGILAEAYLLGDSTIASGSLTGIGSVYDTAVDSRDLSFRFLTERGRIFDGDIVYITPSDSFASAAASAGLSGSDAEPNAIPFSDGVPNLQKYAFNMNLGGTDFAVLVPGTGTSGLPIYDLFEDGGEWFFRVEYLRRRNSGLIYTPKYSTDLDTFTPMTGPGDVVPIDTDWERVVASQPCDPQTTSRCFGLLEVTLPE